MVESIPSLALINGEIYPFAQPGRSSAIFSQGGTVVMLGSDREVLERCAFDTVVLDLRGAVVLPGFVGAGANFSASPGTPGGSGDLRKRLARMADAGVTLAQGDCLGCAEEGGLFGALRELDAAGRLPLRIMPSFAVRSLKDVEEMIAKDIRAERPGSFLIPGPLEIVLDGFLEDRTAALLGDYSDAPGHRGHLLLDREELLAMVLAAHGAGWSTALRATGDAAIEQATDVLSAALDAVSLGARAPRHRLALCAAGNAEQYARLAELGIAVEIRPSDLGGDWAILLSRLGSERARNAYAWKTFFQKGIRVCAGLSSHGRFVAPLEGMRMMINRRDAKGEPPEGWMPGEALDRSEAFWLYTRGAAEAMGLSDDCGTLEPGKAADMVAFFENPFRIPIAELPNVEIGMTIVAGRIRKMI